MSIEIEIAGPEAIGRVEAVNSKTKFPLIYSSAPYLQFLLNALPGSSLVCLFVRDQGEDVGFFPLIIKQAGELTIINSLPFFGSHGGPCFREDFQATGEATELLMSQLGALEQEYRADTVTLVEGPMCPLAEQVMAKQGFEVIDDRVGQITHLPDSRGVDDENLMKMFHVKTRNAVRKGQSLQSVFSVSDEAHAWDWLCENHMASIAGKGGVAKKREVFNHLRAFEGENASSQLHIGEVDGKIEAALLLLYYRGTVEYFTPVVSEEFKNKQILSALIVHSMGEAIDNGYLHWNWGGTWRSQEGVYRFKSRFGASSYPYRYFHHACGDAIHGCSPSDTKKNFEYFYTHKY